MNDCLFLTDLDKKDICVGFSKKDLKKHQGIMGLKYYLVVMYLRKHMEVFGEVNLTLNKLLDECGYSTKTHNKSSYLDFREILQYEIFDKGFAFCDVDVLTVSPSTMFTIYLSGSKSLFYTKDNFVQLSIYEFEKISSCNESKINKSVLIGTYLYIKQFISQDSSLSVKILKMAYPSKQQIKIGIGISSTTTVERAIAILESLKLIYVIGEMYTEDSDENGFFIPTRNAYALNEEDANNDAILSEFEKIYGKPVYKRDDVPGKIKFLEKLKGDK